MLKISAQHSVIGSSFICKCTQAIDVDGIRAIVPQISGQAWVTGYETFVADVSDPFMNGFSLTL